MKWKKLEVTWERCQKKCCQTRLLSFCKTNRKSSLRQCIIYFLGSHEPNLQVLGHLRPAGLMRHWCRWIQPSVLQPAHFLSAAASLQTQTTISSLSERAFRVKQRAKPTVKSAVWNGIISADPQSAERPRDKSGEWNKTQIGAMATWPLWAAQTNSREQKRGEAESRMPIKWFPNALQHDDRRTRSFNSLLFTSLWRQKR